jgi:hypothetical protein
MKLVITLILSVTISAFMLVGFGQSTSKRGSGQSSTRDLAAEGMGREARRIADEFWSGLTKCGTSYFLYSDERLFEFRDVPHFTFDGEALKPKPLSRVEILNGVDPLPVEWQGSTNVSFQVCRMNTSYSELPGAYGYGRTLWNGWSRWTSQHCDFGTVISRAKGKWTIPALKRVGCDDLASWGFVPKPTLTKPSSNDWGETNTLTDSDSTLASYLVMQLNTLEKDGSPDINQIVNRTKDVMSNRLNLIGVVPFKIERIERSDHILVVKLPSLADSPRVKTLLTLTGRLAVLPLLSVKNHSEILQTYPTKAAAVEALGAASPRDFRVLRYVGQGRADAQQESKWAIAQLPEIVGAGGWKNCVVASRGANAATAATCSLNDIGAESLAKWTGPNIGKIVGLVVDGELIGQYIVRSELGTELQLTIPKQAAEDLAILSKSGPLPVRVHIETQGTLSTFRKK